MLRDMWPQTGCSTAREPTFTPPAAQDTKTKTESKFLSPNRLCCCESVIGHRPDQFLCLSVFWLHIWWNVCLVSHARVKTTQKELLHVHHFHWDLMVLCFGTAQKLSLHLWESVTFSSRRRTAEILKSSDHADITCGPVYIPAMQAGYWSVSGPIWVSIQGEPATEDRMCQIQPARLDYSAAANNGSSFRISFMRREWRIFWESILESKGSRFPSHQGYWGRGELFLMSFFLVLVVWGEINIFVSA